MSDSAPTVLGDFLSERELARQLKHHWRSLARWRKQRRGPPFVLVGKDVVYHRDDVAQWLRAGGVQKAATKKAAKRRKAR